MSWLAIPFPSRSRERLGPAGAASECWAPVPHSGKNSVQATGLFGWAIASFPLQPEPRLLPHPHTGSLPSWVALLADGHRGQRQKRCTPVSVFFLVAWLVGGELPIPALLQGHPLPPPSSTGLTDNPQVEFGALVWALRGKEARVCVGGMFLIWDGLVWAAHRGRRDCPWWVPCRLQSINTALLSCPWDFASTLLAWHAFPFFPSNSLLLDCSSRLNSGTTSQRSFLDSSPSWRPLDCPPLALLGAAAFPISIILAWVTVAFP